jgi:hypothetical protein
MAHKHAALIKAWADGATIEYRTRRSWYDESWTNWYPNPQPSWNTDDSTEYRIKPEPHPQQDLIDAAKSGDRTIEFQGALGTGPWYPLVDSLKGEFDEGVPHNVVLRRVHKWQKEMDAAKAGKAIQYKKNSDGALWYNWVGAKLFADDHSVWEKNDYEFRVKPKRVVLADRVVVQSGSRPAFTDKDVNNVEFTFEDGKLIEAKVLS